MGGQTTSVQKPQISHQSTQRDDTKKVVSEILKRVDQLIHKGELDNAQFEINKAKEVDPRNVYVFALEERMCRFPTAKIIDQDEPQRKNEPGCSPATGHPPQNRYYYCADTGMAKTTPGF